MSHDGFSEMDRWDPSGFQADGDGLWMREMAPRLFVGVRFTDMDEHINDWEKGDEYTRYDATVSLVDLDAIGDENIASARDCCGPDDQAPSPRELAYCCIQYGCHAPLHTATGGDLRKVLREARREAIEMMRDSETLSTALGKSVNAIGSTAAEFMIGDMDSAMSRGLAQGDTNARIMAQMHRPIPQGGVSASITMGDVPSDDPIAYSMGFLAGFQGSEETTPRDDLADAYLKGREHGADVRMGKQAIPGWVA